MILEDFVAYLDECGLRFRDRPKAFIMQDCPECGSDGYKVYLYKDEGKDWKNLYGKCVKCESKFTSFKYLIAMGQPIDEVKKLHKIKGLPVADFGKLDILGETENALKVDQYVPIEHTTDHLTPISLKPNFPASKYAISRGVSEDLYNYIMIEKRTNSVAFVCKEDGVVVGYQYRYVNPDTPDMKTWNPPTFKKTHHILEYPNSGDIVICEGPFTAVAAYRYGFHAICTFGSAISKYQINKIINLSKKLDKRVAVSYDLDAAGLGGYFKIKTAFKFIGEDVYRIKPNVGSDLNDSFIAGAGYTEVYEDLEDYTIPVLSAKPFSEGYKP